MPYSTKRYRNSRFPFFQFLFIFHPTSQEASMHRVPNLFPLGRGNFKSILWFAGSVLMVAVAALAVAGCGRVEAKPTGGGFGPLPVDVVKVRQANVPLAGNWVGTLDGFVNAQIQPQVSGYMVRQDYREGAPVAKGQVLFQIDPRPFQAVVDQADAQVQQAKGQLAQAQAQ